MFQTKQQPARESGVLERLKLWTGGECGVYGMYLVVRNKLLTDRVMPPRLSKRQPTSGIITVVSLFLSFL